MSRVRLPLRPREQPHRWPTPTLEPRTHVRVKPRPPFDWSTDPEA